MYDRFFVRVTSHTITAMGRLVSSSEHIVLSIAPGMIYTRRHPACTRSNSSVGAFYSYPSILSTERYHSSSSRLRAKVFVDQAGICCVLKYDTKCISEGRGGGVVGSGM